MRSIALLSFSILLSGCSTILSNTHSISDSSYDSKINLIDLAKYQAPSKADALVAEVTSNVDQSYDYRVGPGDIISVVVYDHPELTIPAGGFRSLSESGSPVHSDGTLYFPFAGDLKVAGMTVNEIRRLLSQKLAKYIESPQVDVRVAAYYSQSIYVSGAVNKVGRMHLDNIPLMLADAITQAGGISAYGEDTQVSVSRDGEVRYFDLNRLFNAGDLSQNILLQDGDVVNVPIAKKQKVFVLGEVNQQQVLEILPQQEISLTEAIAGSGGLDLLSADASGVFVIRDSQNDSKLADVYQLDLSVAVAFVKGTEFLLEPDDVIYVTTAPVSQWNRLLSQLVPSLSGTNTVLDTALKVKSLGN